MNPVSSIGAVVIVLGVVVVNILLANLVWWIVGSKQRVLRILGRAFGGFFALANVALAFVCFLRFWQTGWDWSPIVLFVVSLIFAFRFGGATAGRYP
jgi:hypothetical protein